MKQDLAIDFCGIRCENPFFLSSSVVAGNHEMCARALDMGWSGLVYKTIGFYVPNEVSPRFDVIGKESTPFIGFKNLEQISAQPLEQNIEWLRRLKADFPRKVIVASIMGNTVEEWTDLAKMVTEAGVDMIECNFSCPQMAENTMGSDVGQSTELVAEYCQAVRRGTDKPILAKMTPNLGNIEIPAIAAVTGGANGIAAINTVKSITRVDLHYLSAYPNIKGKSAVSGYSGKAIKPIALRFIHDLAKHPELKGIPLSGMGGIETWEDAVEFMLLGASNLQITTAIMQYGYRIIDDLIEGLSFYMEDQGYHQVQEIVGAALNNIVSPDQLDRSFIVYPGFQESSCVGCGRCFISCGDGGHQAITWERKQRKPGLDKTKCVGCHLCVHVCPVGAIRPGEIRVKIPRDDSLTLSGF